MKMKKEEKRKEKKVRFEGDAEMERKDDSDESIVDSEEDDYEEEEEYDEEVDEADDEEEAKKNSSKIKEEEEEDANEIVKKAQRFKPADGVKFAMYDEYGLPKDDGFNYKQFIVTDDI